jgi:hypothetical protein
MYPESLSRTSLAPVTVLDSGAGEGAGFRQFTGDHIFSRQSSPSWDNSSVRIIGPLTITRNPIGVEVTDVSSAAFFLAPSVSGNTDRDVVCGLESVAHGDASAVGTTSKCPQFRHAKDFAALPKHGKPMP